jgi:hypothetical protein
MLNMTNISCFCQVFGSNKEINGFEDKMKQKRH